MEAEKKINAEIEEEMLRTELNTDSSVAKMVACRGRTADIDLLLEKRGRTTQWRTFPYEGLQDSVSQKFIVDASKLLTSVYDDLNTSLSIKDLNGRISETSSKYKHNPELGKHLFCWSQSRKEMIGKIKSIAESLDQQFFMCNISRIIGSCVGILYSLNFDIYQTFCSSIASYAYNIWPNLGFIMSSVFKLAPHLRFMGFLSSFYEILQSQVFINQLMIAMQNDMNMFMPLKEWFDETKQLDNLVKGRFPYGINKEIPTIIENDLKNLGVEEKIFSAVILSNLKEDPMIYKNGNFLLEVFFFCRSEDAKEWYKRMIMGYCSLDLEYEPFYLHNELFRLLGEREHPDAASRLELGKITVDQLEYTIMKNIRTNLGRLVICSMSGMSIYWCLGNIKAGSRHRYSEGLRKLSANAQSFLNTMEKIRF